MHELRRVNELTVGCRVGSTDVIIEYAMDDRFAGELVIVFPFDVSPYADVAQLLFATWGGAFLAQLCLTRRVTFNCRYSAAMWDALLPISQNLYDVRAFRDGLDIMQAPPARGPQQAVVPSPPSVPERRRTCLLWSGGVDSTLAVSLLDRNGYEVVPVHVSINSGATAGELAAVSSLSRQFVLDTLSVDYRFDQYLDIAKEFSAVIDVFPENNAVPHGRELLLVPIAYVAASKLGCSSVTLGHENNAWTRTVSYKGHRIYRCDTQSEPANVAMQEMLRQILGSEIRLFSPIAPLSDYLKFRLLAEREVAALSFTSACFWGNNCGLCSKCSLHYVLQRALDVRGLSFTNNPLQQSKIIHSAIFDWKNEDQTNWKEYQVALSDIVTGRPVGKDEASLLWYRENVLPKLGPRIQVLRKRLTAVQPVRLLPDDFRYD
ncbi:7-cyano-7-deazaguanine synthase [Micromonospora chalcea]